METVDILALAETAYANILSGQLSEYTLGSKHYSLLNINDLLEHITILRQQFNAEQGGPTSGDFTSIRVQSRFVNPWKGY